MLNEYNTFITIIKPAIIISYCLFIIFTILQKPFIHNPLSNKNTVKIGAAIISHNNKPGIIKDILEHSIIIQLEDGSFIEQLHSSLRPPHD